MEFFLVPSPLDEDIPGPGSSISLHLPVKGLPPFHPCPPLPTASFLDSGLVHSNRAYKSQDAPLPRDLLGNKEPSLRDRGAVHLPSDARRCKSRPSREFPRARPLGPLAGRSRAGGPAPGRHTAATQLQADSGPSPLPLSAAEPVDGWEWRLAELGVRRCYRRAPSHECSGPKS